AGVTSAMDASEAATRTLCPAALPLFNDRTTWRVLPRLTATPPWSKASAGAVLPESDPGQPASNPATPIASTVMRKSIGLVCTRRYLVGYGFLQRVHPFESAPTSSRSAASSGR